MLLQALFVLIINRVECSHSPFSTKDPEVDLKIPSVQRTSNDFGTTTSFWSSNLLDGRPLPTNAWWMNFVLPVGEDVNNNVYGFPYVFIAKSNGLNVINPYIASSTMQVQSFFDPADSLLAPIVLGSPQINSPHVVSGFDVLSTTVSWSDSSMYSTIIRGDSFATMIYNGKVSASVSSAQVPISIKYDGVSLNCSVSSTSTVTEVEVTFQLSDTTYLIFFDGPTEVKYSAESYFTISSTSPYTGAVRVALTNNCTYGTNPHHCPQENLNSRTGLNQTSFTTLIRENYRTYVISGDVNYSIDENTKQASVSFDYTTKSMSQSSSITQGSTASGNGLLLYTMPHHRDSLASSMNEVYEYGSHRTIRGLAKPLLVLSDNSIFSMKFTEPITALTFSYDNPIDSTKIEDIRASLKNDASYDLPLNYQLGAGDTYFSGKMIAKLARLVLIAEELNEMDIHNTLLNRLKERVEIWVNGSSEALQLYDLTWGGYVSCGCYYDDCYGQCTPFCNNVKTGSSCPALIDSGMNFGNAAYNDHHFHYGYHLYGAAVVAKYDTAWTAKNAELFLLFARDYMNPSIDDKYFVQWRMLDWYAGHSWAGGISLGGGVAYYNGRNQESSSESVHSYYAAALFGQSLSKVTGYESVGENLETSSRVALALELRSTDKYWHVYQSDYPYIDTNEPNIYDQPYRDNSVVGILWSNLAQFQTWFGSASYLVHGIQQVPYTPISEHMLPSEWVKEEYPKFSSGCSANGACASDGWQTFVVLEQSIIDKESAWQNAKLLPDSAFSNDVAGGNGNSRTNTLHFIASRH